MSTLVPQTARIGRRTVVRTGAWTLPVVSMAANLPPVPLSGPCLPFDVGVVWTGNGYTRNSNASATYVASFVNPVTSQNEQITITLSSALFGNTKYGYEDNNSSDNLRLSGVVIGGTGAQGITMHQNLPERTPGTMRTNRQELTFTFDKPVYDLSFGISDIDSAAGDFYDQVELTSPSAFTFTRGNTVQGNGIPTDPWRNNSNNAPVDNASGAGNANINFTQPVTTFKIYYWDNRPITTSGIDNDQKIFITNLNFKVSGCDWNP